MVTGSHGLESFYYWNICNLSMWVGLFWIGIFKSSFSFFQPFQGLQAIQFNFPLRFLIQGHYQKIASFNSPCQARKMDSGMNPEELSKLNARIKSQFAGEFIQMMTEVCGFWLTYLIIYRSRPWNRNASLGVCANLEIKLKSLKR